MTREFGELRRDKRDAAIRARLEAATEDKDGKAEKAIWAAVVMSTGMGAVPFGINIGWFFAVSTGLIIYLGELYGFTYTKRQAAALLRQFLTSCGWTWAAFTFGTKFMAEALKGAGIITMGGATPIGMALDAVLCGGITYAIGFTTLKYVEDHEELSGTEMRREFRARFQESKEQVRDLARQRGAEFSTEVRSRYATAAVELKSRLKAR